MRDEMVGRNVVHAWRQRATDLTIKMGGDKHCWYYICRNPDGGFDLGWSRGLIRHCYGIRPLLVTTFQVDMKTSRPVPRFVVWIRFLRSSLHAGTKLMDIRWKFLWDEVEGGVDWGS